MSEIRETSYYEIALTNRQVLTVFVILLACLVAAFLSGVWIGRRGGSLPVETVAAQTITSGVAAGEEPLGELRFFSESGQGQGPGGEPGARPRRAAEPAPAAGPPQGAAAAPEPQAGEAPSRSPARREPAVPPPATEPAAPSERPAAPAAAAPAPATPPAPAPAAPAPAAATAEPAPAAEPTARSLVVIQVFSSSDRGQAERVVERLRTAGLPALLAPVEVSGRTMYRVRIGPYRDPDQAESVAERVRKEFRLDTWIID